MPEPFTRAGLTSAAGGAPDAYPHAGGSNYFPDPRASPSSGAAVLRRHCPPAFMGQKEVRDLLDELLGEIVKVLRAWPVWNFTRYADHLGFAFGRAGHAATTRPPAWRERRSRDQLIRHDAWPESRELLAWRARSPAADGHTADPGWKSFSSVPFRQTAVVALTYVEAQRGTGERRTGIGNVPGRGRVPRRAGQIAGNKLPVSADLGSCAPACNTPE